MKKIHNILIIFALTLNMCAAQNKWSWPQTKSNPRQRDNYPYARADREREPTTKRPLPGQPQNDNIDDYTDTSDEVNKQDSPYLPPGLAGNPLIAGNYNGFANFPQFTGNAPNGIIVGPGGPTGIIGRPQAHFPAGVQSSIYTSAQAAYPGFSFPQHFPAAANNNNPGFTNYNGLKSVSAQYPSSNVNNPQQFSVPQYPQTQFHGVQYPQQAQYTEGYGLANLNTGFNANPQFNGNFNSNYEFGFDEYPEELEDKSANVKAINKKVDDKVTKNVKKL